MRKERETILVLRSCKSDLTSYKGFQWPDSGEVVAPDWDPSPICGNGLHGWLWGFGDFTAQYIEPTTAWLVVEVIGNTIINLEGKVKFPRGRVIYCGNFTNAFSMVRKEAFKRGLE